MKRIYYAGHTLDVGYELGELLQKWIEELATGRYWTTANYSGVVDLRGGPESRFYAVPGYLDGSTDETVLTILVGRGHDIAFSDSPQMLPNARGTDEAALELTSWLADND